MAYKIPVSNSNIVVGATKAKLKGSKVVTKGRVFVQKQLKGDVTINGGKLQNITIPSYADLDNIPTVKTFVAKIAKEQAAQQKYHVKFL